MGTPRLEIDAMRITLLDPRSVFYSMHPELPPITIICKLRATSHELCVLAQRELEECWAMLKIHRLGAPLPLPLKKLLAKTQVELQLMRYIQRHACDSNRIIAGSFPLHRAHAGIKRDGASTRHAGCLLCSLCRVAGVCIKCAKDATSVCANCACASVAKSTKLTSRPQVPKMSVPSLPCRRRLY